MLLSKIIKTVHVVAISVFTMATSSCSTTFDEHKDNPDVDNPVAQRTIVVYMVANNSLAGNAWDDLKEMQKIAETGTLAGNRLIAFHENIQGTQMLKEVDLTDGHIDTLKTYDSAISAVDIDRMLEVFSDVKVLAPAHDYGLILWGHGDGWRIRNSSPNSSTSSKTVNTSSFGGERKDGTTLWIYDKDLARVLANQDFSFIYFDDCYGASIESLYELKDIPTKIVASTTEVIDEGMPYHLSLPYLFARGEADLEGAIDAVYTYMNDNMSSGLYGTYALLDQSKLENLAQTAKTLYQFHPTYPSGFKPQKYMWESTCYFFDLEDMVDNMILSEDASDETFSAFEDARTAVKEAISKYVVYKKATEYIWPTTPGYRFKIDRFCGISAYFITQPSQATTYGYNTTSWWNDVAKYQFESTSDSN